MKKGDIVWIRRNDCIFCSEIDYIKRDISITGLRYTEIRLIPIIGTCVCLFSHSDFDLKECKNFTVLGYFKDSPDSFGWHDVQIALNVENLCLPMS